MRARAPSASGALVPLALAALLALAVSSPAPARADDPPPTPPVNEIARREALDKLERSLRKNAASPRAEKLRDEIGKDLEALEALGGPDAAYVALEALAFDDEAVEKRVFALVELTHDKSLTKRLLAVLDARENRRRFRLHAQIAHAFAVIADPLAVEALTDLVGSEDAAVVAAAADTLAGFKQLPHAKRLEPVRRMIDRFESCWNLKESRRPEDKIATDKAKGEWEVYGSALRRSLQALTGQSQLTKPRQFREWWNDAKKATNW
jgi:hypothetical protein